LHPRYEFKIGGIQLRINIWYFLIFLLAQSVLNQLGFWQLQRAKEKHHRLQQVEAGLKSQINNLAEIDQAKIEMFQTVQLDLKPIAETIYLDNAIYNKQVGYQVFQIAEDSVSAKTVLVNRGWIRALPNREQLPEAETVFGNWQIKGRVYPVADESFIQPEQVMAYVDGHWLLSAMNMVAIESLEKKFRVDLQDYMIRIDGQSEYALEANWVWINMSPDKHLAYAIQWFGLALALLILSVIVAIKKR